MNLQRYFPIAHNVALFSLVLVTLAWLSAFTKRLHDIGSRGVPKSVDFGEKTRDFVVDFPMTGSGIYPLSQGVDHTHRPVEGSK